MILARNGRVQAETGHDHESHLLTASGTTPLTLPAAHFMITKILPDHEPIPLS
jgi:hypothetical protein